MTENGHGGAEATGETLGEGGACRTRADRRPELATALPLTVLLATALPLTVLASSCKHI